MQQTLKQTQINSLYQHKLITTNHTVQSVQQCIAQIHTLAVPTQSNYNPSNVRSVQQNLTQKHTLVVPTRTKYNISKRPHNAAQFNTHTHMVYQHRPIKTRHTLHSVQHCITHTHTTAVPTQTNTKYHNVHSMQYCITHTHTL